MKRQRHRTSVEKDLLAFKAVLDKNTNLRSFLSNPTISREEKVGALSKERPHRT